MRVSVPKGTIGALTDADGNSYYDLTTNIVVAQPVTFEFVDTYDNNKVIGQAYSQEFVPGKKTNLDFTMTMPEGEKGVYDYVLADGQSLPTSYTLQEFSEKPVVVKIGVHQSMHFKIVFWDDTENKELYSTEVPSANAANGGYYIVNFPAGTFPAGVNAGYYASVGATGVPEGATFSGNYKEPLTDPSTDWTVPNYQWDKTEAVEKALTGATITIHVKHKTEVLGENSNIPDGTKTAEGQLVTRDDFSKTFTRKITEYLPAATGTEQTKDLSQTVTINRTGVRDLVTGILTWNDYKDGESNVKFADGAISGQASYKITPLSSAAKLANTEEGNYSKVYNAQTTDQIDPSKFQITATVNGQLLNTTGITGNSYQWVDADGNALTTKPTNVGTYYVKLTDTAFQKLQADNPNYTLTNTGLGVYKITPAQGSATLSGNNSKVYDGQVISVDQLNSNGQIKVNLNFPGGNNASYTLQSGDYTISGNATDAGDYTINLTQAGITNIENYIKSLAGTG